MIISGEVKFIGDVYPGAYSNGLSMIGSDTMNRFKEYSDTGDVSADTKKDNVKAKVDSVNAAGGSDSKSEVYITKNGIKLIVEHKPGKSAGVTCITTSITNESEREVNLEMLTSFYLKDIKADKLHRMLSCWSSEGRHKVEAFNELNLEASWTKHAPRIFKFGNVGSMPVRSYFPFVALEDSESGHFTAVSLYSPSSWQIEVIRHHEEDKVNLAGGIADRDFGHWSRVLKPGETLTAPKAVVAEGDSFLEVCNLLVEEQTPDISPIDNDMGITFNEYCTTWGDPSIENLKKIADKIAGKGIKYLVMDSGWYLERGQYWWDYIGRWEVNKDRFPNGLKELSEYIRSKGMIPGIWFEPESLAWGSDIFDNRDCILTKDGYPINIGGKRFLDMESEKARDFLREKVIKLLKDNDFGYIKIDYNDTIGIGCDGTDSLGENLRRKVLASQDFFRELRKEIPDLVIENCSSGGHRLEASMMELASMASFSDAHETKSIPIIAASLQCMVRPEQNQIWAVMRKEDSDARIYYSLISTFLGRMGLSGDIYDLSDHQWSLIDEGISFYKEASSIIKNGRTVILDCSADSWNNPEGRQFTVREYNGKYLAIMHRFKDRAGEAFSDYCSGEAFSDCYSGDIDIRNLISDIVGVKGITGEDLAIIREYGDLSDEFSAKAWIIQNRG